MIEIIAGGCILLAIIYHIRAVTILKVKIAAPNLVYVDREGIQKNPPQYFIDAYTNKVINFKVNDFIITIAQIPIFPNLNYLKLMAEYHSILIKYVDVMPTNEKDKLEADRVYKEAYERIIDLIFHLSYQFVKNKKKYKKQLYQRCHIDVLFTLDICEQISDYWKLIKKKALLLSSQTTLRQTVGEGFSWNSVDLGTGKRITIKPRYAQFWNSLPREMMGFGKSTKGNEKKGNNGNG